MKTKNEAEDIGIKILTIANVVRKANLVADKQIADALKESGYSKYEAAYLLEFIEMFRSGTPKKKIIRDLNLSPELVKKFDKYKLAW